MKCPKCNYEWEARKKKPKSCPLCKQYLKRKGAVATQRMARGHKAGACSHCKKRRDS